MISVPVRQMHLCPLQQVGSASPEKSGKLRSLAVGYSPAEVRICFCRPKDSSSGGRAARTLGQVSAVTSTSRISATGARSSCSIGFALSTGLLGRSLHHAQGHPPLRTIIFAARANHHHHHHHQQQQQHHHHHHHHHHHPYRQDHHSHQRHMIFISIIIIIKIIIVNTKQNKQSSSSAAAAAAAAPSPSASSLSSSQFSNVVDANAKAKQANIIWLYGVIEKYNV